MYKLSILTPEKTLFEGMVESAVLPGKDGFFEVLTNHMSIVSLLKNGKLLIKTDQKEELTFAITGGFFEFASNKGTVLADGLEE